MMRRRLRPVLLALAAALLLPASGARAAPEGWHETLDAGLEAARASGRPVLLVTAWRSGI